MICICGAGGTVGSELARQLEAANVPYRATFFSKDKADAARARGVDAVAIDYHRPATLEAAFEGCDRLFLLAPNAPDLLRFELNAVAAAKAAGVRHVVKQSVVGAAVATFTLAAIHRQVEQAIEASGMAWTFLRPNSFMQNLVTYMGAPIRAESAFYNASGEARISHVDVRDIAAVAVAALTGDGHEGKAYTLTGPEALTYGELAAALSQALGRPIRHVSLPPEAWKGGMLAAGVPEEIADRLVDLDRFYREGHASRVTDDIRQVTGRDPGPFASFAQACAPLLQPA